MSAEIVIPDWLVERRGAPPPESVEADPEAFEREARRRYGRLLAASVAASRAADAARDDIAAAGDPADSAGRFAAALDGIARDHGAEFAGDETSRAIFRRDFDALARHRLAEFGADAARREQDGLAQALVERFDGLRDLADAGDADLRGEALRQAALEAHRAAGFGLVVNAQTAFDDFMASLAPAAAASPAHADRVVRAPAFARESALGAQGLLVPVAKKRLDLPGSGDALGTEGAPTGPRGGGGGSARAPRYEAPASPRPAANPEQARGGRAVDEAASSPQFKPGPRIDAETANRRYPDYDPQPYPSGTSIREVTLSRASGRDEFVRVHTGPDAKGKWLVRRTDIEGLTPAEIKQRLALPAEPTHISDVRLPSGTKLRIGAINKGDDGVLQFEIQGSPQRSWFRNTREIAW